MTDAPEPMPAAPRPDVYARIMRFAPVLVVGFCIALLVIVAFVRPFDTPPSTIKVDRPMVGTGFDPTGAYMIIHDSGGADTLLSASSPAAASITFQTFATTTSTAGGSGATNGSGGATDLTVSGSGAVPVAVPTLEVPGFADLRLVPGEAQLLLSGLTAPLVAGQKVPITLVFERAGSITVEAIAGSYNDIADRLLPPRLVTN